MLNCSRPLPYLDEALMQRCGVELRMVQRAGLGAALNNDIGEAQ
jgi:hypothetical protein